MGRLARSALLRAGHVRLTLPPAPLPALVTAPPAALLAGLLLTGCSPGIPPVEACVEHSVDEGVGRAAAQAACEDVVED